MVEKDISSVKHWKEAFWETALCSVSSFHVHFTTSLKKSCTKTVLVKFQKWYLEAHRGLWWKSKSLPLKTGKKLCLKLLCVLLIHLTKLQISPQEDYIQDCSCGICKVIIGSPWRAMVKRKYLHLETGKNLSEKLLCVLLIHLTDYSFPLKKTFAKTVLVEYANRDIWKPTEGYGEKGNLFR